MKLTSRTYIMLGLVLATAISALLQYVSQGILATGHSATYFAEAFWRAEGALWGLRALVDACVVAFLFATKARNATEAKVLTAFEIALLAIITVTLGPAMASMGYGVAMKDVMPKEAFWVWNFAIASYSPIMMGAAGYAYKCGETENSSPKPIQESAKNMDELAKRIVALLEAHGSLKPGQLATMTGAKAWQVSRAVSALVHDGVASKNGTVQLIKEKA